MTKTYKQLMEEMKGTYAGVRLDKKSNNLIETYMKEHDVPNRVPTDKLHITLLYSRKYLPNYKPSQTSYPMSAKTVGFHMWKTQSLEHKDSKNCLVLEINAPKLIKRHKELMDEHEATFDYPEYKTHITLSYDIGDFDISDLPKMHNLLTIEKEYKEDLDLNWADKHG